MNSINTGLSTISTPSKINSGTNSENSECTAATLSTDMCKCTITALSTDTTLPDDAMYGRSIFLVTIPWTHLFVRIEERPIVTEVTSSVTKRPKDLYRPQPP